MKMTRRQLRRLIREVYTPGSPMDIWKRTGMDPSDARKITDLSISDIAQAREIEDISGYPLGSATVMPELLSRDRYIAVMSDYDYDKLMYQMKKRYQTGRYIIQHHSEVDHGHGASTHTVIFNGEMFRWVFREGSRGNPMDNFDSEYHESSIRKLQ